jgi:hypothetical protein
MFTRISAILPTVGPTDDLSAPTSRKEKAMRFFLASLALIGCVLTAGSAAQQNVITPSTGLQLVPIAPCRLVDTRLSNGPFGGPPIQGGTYRSFPVPQGGCGIPANAGAYLLDVIVIPLPQLRYLAVYPTGQNPGVTTTTNSPDGRIKGNAVIVPAGTNASIDVYASDETNVLIDIFGYFAPPSGSTLMYFPLTPCRVIDTRGPDGPLGGPFLRQLFERDFPVLQGPCIPQGAVALAYSFNVTGIPRNRNGDAAIWVWQQGQPRPLPAVVDARTGIPVSNAAIVPAGTSGGVAAWPNNDTDMVVDINGYFAPPGSGGLSLYAVPPCRVLDTRRGAVGFIGELTVPVLNPSRLPCVVARNAQAFVFSATAYPQGSLEYLTLWADGFPQPNTWTLNAADGAVTSNMAIVSSTNGSIDAYAPSRTQMTLDIMTYFGP